MYAFPDLPGDLMCPECGEIAVCHQESLALPPLKGDNDIPALPKDDPLACVQSEDGSLYPPKTTIYDDWYTHFVLPTGEDWEYVELWDGFELHVFQEKVWEKGGDAACTWCFSTFKMGEVIRFNNRSRGQGGGESPRENGRPMMKGQYDCPRCGGHTVVTTHYFLSTFGHPERRDVSGSSLLCIEDGEGEIYPVRDGESVLFPEADEFVEVWDEDAVRPVQQAVFDSGESACCAYCYYTTELEEVQ